MNGLVYHTGALGDFVAALPAIAVWRRRPHGAAASRAAARESAAGPGRVVLLGRPAHAALAAGVIDGAWDAGSSRFASLFAGRPSGEVREMLADISTALVFAAEGSGIVRGIERGGVREIVRGDPFPRGRVHIVDHHLSLFPEPALAPEERIPRVEASPAAEDAAVGSASGRPIVLHPGSGSPAKNWPLEGFLELARRLAGFAPIAWALGPAEEEAGTARAIARSVAWRDLPLPELARRLAGSALFVGNDSGVAHLAAACGCPVVALFGASDPAVWAPRGRSGVAVVGDGACGMEAIGVEEVAAACRGFLAPVPGGDAGTIACYDRSARQYGERYEAADMSILYTLLLRYLPQPGASILELGCGSGRDAAFLLSRGYDVTAIDASAGMIAEAVRLHPELAGRLSCAAVPFPDDSPLLLCAFDVVFSNAVLMHLPDAALREAARQIRRLLRPNGVLVISVSVGRAGLRHGRDGTGRLFRERPPEEYRRLFEDLGLRLVDRHEAPDSPERPTIRWISLVFRCA